MGYGEDGRRGMEGASGEKPVVGERHGTGSMKGHQGIGFDHQEQLRKST
jgi:hypothetical protein